MCFYRNKKSILSKVVVIVIAACLSALVLFLFVGLILNNVDTKAADLICKESVALREMSHLQLRPGGVTIAEVASPLLCKTGSLYLPEDKDATKEKIKKQLAELMASCWNRYGEGLIEDVFKQGDPTTNNCQVCYIISLRETSEFKDEIKSVDFLHYLLEKPYKVSSEDDNCKIGGGFCIDSNDVSDCADKINAPDDSYLLIDEKGDFCTQKGKSACCYTDYECLSKGAVCAAENPDIEEYKEYGGCDEEEECDDEESKGWECPGDMKCFVKIENYYSYGEYIQRYGGSGNLMILTDIKPGETYAISFGGPTESCSWCTTIGGSIGGAAGAGAVVGIAIAAAVAGGFTMGVGTVAVLAVAAAGAGFVGGAIGVNFAVSELFEGRDVSTVYLTTLDQIQEGKLCRIVHEIGEK